MGLFDLLKTKTVQPTTPARLQVYDLDTVAGINSIPIPAKENTYYVLQRKATEHKKNGKMNEAIACLRKSNALSDNEIKPLLLEKDYLRLVKYLEAAGRHDEAAIAEKEIYDRHPEFADKRISNKKRIQETLNKCKKYNEDLVYITTKKTCPVCGKYDHKIYSISGKSKKYPILPSKFVTDGGYCKNCFADISIKFDI